MLLLAWISQSKRLIQGKQKPSLYMGHSWRLVVYLANVIYCITCTLSKKLYICETGRRPGDRFYEHLRDVKKDDKDASRPVACPFNLPNHSKQHMAICGFPYINVPREATGIWNKNSYSKSFFVNLIYSCFSRCHVNTNSVAPSPLYKLHTTYNSLISSDEGLMLEMSAFRIPVWWSIYIINSIDKTKFLWRLVDCVQQDWQWSVSNRGLKFGNGLIHGLNPWSHRMYMKIRSKICHSMFYSSVFKSTIWMCTKNVFLEIRC